MYMVTFSVKTPLSLRGCKVFVVGSCPELGSWTPNLATPLKLESSSESGDLWSAKIFIQSAAKIEYRFFTGYVLQKASGTRHLITIHTWESFNPPRSTTLCVNGTDCGEVNYGCLNNDSLLKFESGWLMGQSEIHLRLSSLNLDSDYEGQLMVKCKSVSKKRNSSSASVTSLESLHGPVFYTMFGCDGQQFLPEHGIIYPGNDKFLTMKIQTCCVDQLALKITLSCVADHTCIDVGSVFVTPHSRKKADTLHTAIVSGPDEIAGTVMIDVLIIDPLSDDTLDGCFVPRQWMRNGNAITIGHRGMGSSYDKGMKNARFPENTIRSLAEAGKNGADMVEFDVLLTRDEVPVVFHDFLGCITTKHRDSNDECSLELSVADLTYRELQGLKVQKRLDCKAIFPASEEEQPFPTLKSCLEKVDSTVAFDIEIKYCMYRRETNQMEDNLKWFPERNRYVDIVLRDILKYAGSRRIILSCFDPDVCMMLHLKQARFPVIFLSQGETTKYPAFLDSRAAALSLAVEFAAAESLAGVAVHTEGLLKELCLIDQAHVRGMAIFCWGTDNNCIDNLKLLRSRGVDGICYDRIDEFRIPDDSIIS